MPISNPVSGVATLILIHHGKVLNLKYLIIPKVTTTRIELDPQLLALPKPRQRFSVDRNTIGTVGTRMGSVHWICFGIRLNLLGALTADPDAGRCVGDASNRAGLKAEIEG